MTSSTAPETITDDLIADLRRRGVRLARRDGRLRVDAPKGSLDSVVLGTLTERREDILELLALQDAVLSMPLSRFEQDGLHVEFAVEGIEPTLWLVPSERDVQLLAREGIHRGRVWTVRELRSLIRGGSLPADGLRELAQVKLAFGGTVEEAP